MLNLWSCIRGQMNKYDRQRKSQPEFYRAKSFFISLSSEEETGTGRKSVLEFPQHFGTVLCQRTPEELKLSQDEIFWWINDSVKDWGMEEMFIFHRGTTGILRVPELCHQFVNDVEAGRRQCLLMY